MALEFEKLVPQVALMGRAVAGRASTVAEQTQAAGEVLMEMNDLDAIWDRIMLARDKDAGFRGAAPMQGVFAEPINVSIPLPPAPDYANILASDGSQIFPDPHGAALYWLTNIAVFIYPHGSGVDTLPEYVTEPQLFYDDHDVRDTEGRIVPNAAISARRSVSEMQMLARETFLRRKAARPLLGLYDGPLLGLFGGKDVTNGEQLKRDYHEAFSIMADLGAILAGYVDRPKSTFLVNTIYLMTLGEDEVTRARLQTAGPLEGLSDRDLYQHILGPGERSGLMIQQSPTNKEYKEFSPDHEIVFFYLNVASPNQEPYLARVEVPMYVAQRKEMVSALQALIYSQCQIIDRFPYALTRADEIAVVPGHEKRALDELIAIELLKNKQRIELSQKLNTKGMARHGREQHQGV
jgi:hypothetical protein